MSLLTTTAIPKPAPTRSERGADAGARMLGLDGVRALAVIAVVVYHANANWLSGGFFGVDLFFVISGYLITSIVVRQWQLTGGIDLRHFWLRRARRLLPAVVVLIAVVIAVSTVAAPDALARLSGDVPAALGYVTNWWFIFHKDSYFAAVGRPPLLQHLWSLAIEEQFYVVWPLVLTFVLPRVRRLRNLAAGTAVAAAVSTALMAILFHPNEDASRVYYGTDTHAQGLLIGCTLALVIPPALLAARRSRPWRIGLDVGGAAGLAALAFLMVTLTDFGTTTYRGGFLLVDVAAAAVVLAAASPVTSVGWVLGQQPLRWVGTRSYAIYLWHWPIDQWLRPHIDVGFGGVGLFVLQAALTAAAAELSYRFVEQPVRTGQAQAWVKERFQQSRSREPWIVVPGLVVLLLTADVLHAKPPQVTGILAQGSTAASHVKLSAGGEGGGQGGGVGSGNSMGSGGSGGSGGARTPSPPASSAAPRPASSGPADAQRGLAPSPAASSPPTTAPAPAPAPAPALLAADEPVLAIGDSVMLAASPALQARFGPEITVDATVGRHVQDGITRLAQYKSSGLLARYKTLVIGLGTNGPMTTAMFNQLVALATGVPNVVFVNTFDTRSWETPTNQVLAAGVAANPAVKLANWSAAAAANEPLLYADHIHPDPQGAVLYTNLVVEALNPPPAAPAASGPAGVAPATTAAPFPSP